MSTQIVPEYKCGVRGIRADNASTSSLILSGQNLTLSCKNSPHPTLVYVCTHVSLSYLSCVFSAHLLTVVARHHYFCVGSVHAQGVTVNCAST